MKKRTALDLDGHAMINGGSGFYFGVSRAKVLYWEWRRNSMNSVIIKLY